MAGLSAPSHLKAMLGKPTIYYVVLFALSTGFFQSGYGLTYHESLFHIGRQHAIPLWVAANLAQLVGIVVFATASYLWPRRATSLGTFGSLALFAVAAAGATAASYGTVPVLATGGIFLATTSAMTGFVLLGISRHASPRMFGRIVSAGLCVGMVAEFVTMTIVGEANPSYLAWALTSLVPLTMYFVYRVGLNRVFFDVERTIVVPDASQRQADSVASFPNVLVLASTAGLMKLIALLGIVRPKLVSPDIIDQYPLIQAFIIIGVAVVGPLMDRSRRAGAVATVSSLTISFVAVAFMQLADSSSAWSQPVTYSIGYVMVGSTVAFALIAFLDLASRTRSLLPYAIGGMVIHSGVEAAVMGIPDSVIAHPAQSAMLLAALFAVVVPLASLARNRIWPPLIVGDRISGHTQPNLSADALVSDSGAVSIGGEDAARTSGPMILSTPEQRLHDFGARFSLSLRERELLLELLDGHSNAQIASRLYISESTVKFHVRNILDKTGCESRVEVINLYWRLEL